MEASKAKNDAPAKEPTSSVNGILMPVSIKTVETSSKHDNPNTEARKQGEHTSDD